MLAEELHAQTLAVKQEHVIQVTQHGLVLEISGDILTIEAREDPGISDRGAADHDRIAGGVVEDALNIGDGADIAIGDDRDGEGLLQLGDGIPIRTSRIALGAGASVYGDQRTAALFNGTPDNVR